MAYDFKLFISSNCLWLQIVYDFNSYLTSTSSCQPQVSDWQKRLETLELFMPDSRESLRLFVLLRIVHDNSRSRSLMCKRDRIVHGRLSRILYAVFVYNFELFMTTPGLLCAKETGISRIVHDQLSRLEVIRAVFVRHFELFMTPPGLYPPKNGVITLWPNTRVVKCKYYVSQKQNGFNNKIHGYSILLNFIFKFAARILWTKICVLSNLSYCRFTTWQHIKSGISPFVDGKSEIN